MKDLHCEIEIDAPAERVWQILTDFASFPQWNPFIRRIGGEPRVGEQLEVYLQLSGARGITFRGKVLGAEPPRELRLMAPLIRPGLFDREHIILIEAVEPGHVRFVQRVVYGGLLVPLFPKSLQRIIRRGFEQMNRAIKARAEA
jgi:hypothetical protein